MLVRGAERQTAKWIRNEGLRSTIWEAASPKQISSGSKEQKFDHPTQKPIALMERPIKNHDGAVYEPFGGSGSRRDCRRNTREKLPFDRDRAAIR